MQHPAFRRVWLSSVSANLARFTDFTIIAWLLVQRTDAASAIGLLIFARFASFFFLGPFVGLVADRYPRIRVLRLTQAGIGVAALAMAALLFTGGLAIWHIYLYAFVNGLLFMFEISSKRPYMAAAVGRRDLTAALALDMISLNVAWFVGANAGGLLVSVARPGLIYVGLASIFFVNVFFLRGLPVLFRPRHGARKTPALASLIDGFRYARRNRLVMGALLLLALNNLTGFTFESMAPLFARDVYGAGPVLFGLLMSAQGLGAVLSALGVAAYGKRVRRPGLIMVVAALVQHLGALAFSFAGLPVAGFVLLVSLGSVSMVFAIMHNTLLLSATPNDMRGRVVGLQILAMGLFPFGSLAVAALADVTGLQEAVRLFSIAGIAGIVLLWFLFPELRRSAIAGQTGESASRSVPPAAPSKDIAA